MVSLRVNEYVMTSNEIATEFCALVILKGSSAGGEKKHSIESGRRKERQDKGEGEGGKKGYNLECRAELKPHILPQSIDEKVFAHVLSELGD